MKVIATCDFYDLKAFVGRQEGEAIEVTEDRGAELTEKGLAKPEAKPAAKKTAKK